MRIIQLVNSDSEEVALFLTQRKEPIDELQSLFDSILDNAREEIADLEDGDYFDLLSHLDNVLATKGIYRGYTEVVYSNLF